MINIEFCKTKLVCGQRASFRVLKKSCGACWSIKSIGNVSIVPCDGGCVTEVEVEPADGGCHCFTVPEVCSGFYRVCFEALTTQPISGDIEARKVLKEVEICAPETMQKRLLPEESSAGVL